MAAQGGWGTWCTTGFKAHTQLDFKYFTGMNIALTKKQMVI